MSTLVDIIKGLGILGVRISPNDVNVQMTVTGQSAAWRYAAGAYTANILGPTGANSFILDIEVADLATGPWLANYITLTGTSATSTPAADGDASEAQFAFARANLSALSLGAGSALLITRAQNSLPQLVGTAGADLSVPMTGTPPIVSSPWAFSAGQYTAEIITPTGANSFRVDIQVSNSASGPWITDFITLAATSATSTPAIDGDSAEVSFAFARANVTALALGGGARLLIKRLQYA